MVVSASIGPFTMPKLLVTEKSTRFWEISTVVSCHPFHIGIFDFGFTWITGMLCEQNFSINSFVAVIWVFGDIFISILSFRALCLSTFLLIEVEEHFIVSNFPAFQQFSIAFQQFSIADDIGCNCGGNVKKCQLLVFPTIRLIDLFVFHIDLLGFYSVLLVFRIDGFYIDLAVFRIELLVSSQTFPIHIDGLYIHLLVFHIDSLVFTYIYRYSISMSCLYVEFPRRDS